MLKKIVWGFVVFLVLILIFISSAVAPIDDTPLQEFESITQTSAELDKIQMEPTAVSDSTLRAGWASVNITPHTTIDMAGYGPRGPYTSVSDSLFVRTMVFDNGVKKAVVISLDLLMFPRIIKTKIEKELKVKGFSNDELFLSATHTHNGFGNWEKSIVGELIFGEFDDDNVNYLVQQISKSVSKALESMSPAQLAFQKIDANELVINRVAPKTGTKDPFIRVINVQKDNGEKGMIVSFSGHAVNLDADIWDISRDYPGILVDELENNPNISFAMFCAGMVASHNIDSDLPKGQERIIKTGRLLSNKIIEQQNDLEYDSRSTISTLDIEIGLPPSQLRITPSLRLRDWIFSFFLGPLQANIKALEIGDVLMMGMPCDYSGELSINHQLDQFAADHGKELFITSFNGNYIGYITEDAHYYTCSHDEVKSLNWVGPFKGAYFTDNIRKIIEKTVD